MWAVLGQPDSIGIEDENAVIAERDFLGLPRGFVAVGGAQPGSPTPATTTRSSSLAGIHCLMACQGSSMGSKVSMSKGGDRGTVGY
jgi:hypothetical protein